MTSTRDYAADLLRAVLAKWSATGSLAVINGPHLNQKPGDKATSIPYCIVSVADSFDDGWSCRKKRWSTTLAFEFWNRSPELADASKQLFLDVFGVESLSLTISSGSLWDHRMVGSSVVNEQPGLLAHSDCLFRFRTEHDR